MIEDERRPFVRAAVKNYQAAMMGMSGVRGRDTRLWMESLMIIAVFGRGVTSSLDRLKNRDPEFFEWYVEQKRIMADDPLCSWFYAIRTQVLKQGELPKVKTEIRWEAVEIGEGTTSFGTDDLDYTTAEMIVIDGPTEHNGMSIESPTVLEYSRLYLLFLERLVSTAAARVSARPEGGPTG